MIKKKVFFISLFFSLRKPVPSEPELICCVHFVNSDVRITATSFTHVWHKNGIKYSAISVLQPCLRSLYEMSVSLHWLYVWFVEDSQGSSPDQDRMLSGSSPQINRFSSRAPPDGCERVLSKSVPILRPIPREVVSHPTTLYTLKPSSHSAFESLHRGMQVSQQDEEMDGDSPKVPEQEDP